MPTGQPERQPASSKRHRRSFSHSMAQPQGVIDLTESSELETSRSRKHDRHEPDSQSSGPSKRAKLQRNSEPPTRKHTSMIPKRKRKKSGRTVNTHEASRTIKHHELKKSSKTIEGELWAAKKTLREKEKELRDTKQKDAAELKRVRKICDDKTREVQKHLETIESDRQEREALRESCAKKDEELKAKDEDIVAKQKELDQTKKDLEETRQQAEAARILNDSNGAWNEGCYRREQTAKDKLGEARKVHKKKVAGLEKERHDLVHERNALTLGLKTREKEHSVMIARLQHQLQDSYPQSQRFNFKVSDEKVQQDYMNIKSKIREFVDTYARPVFNVADQELRLIWPGWSCKLSKFLESPLLCSLVFEGYVWECLLARVFTSWSKVWTGELGLPLEKALGIAAKEIEDAGYESELYVDYQYWRSNSSGLIDRLNGADFRPKYFDSDVQSMVSTIANLCGLHDVTETMKTDAMSIFKDARELEIQLRKLKAAYSFHMCKPVPNGHTFKYGVFFDDEGMVDCSPCPSDKKHGRVPSVDFIMSPGLHKRGNNDGDNYEDDTWIIKMGVVCDAARFLIKRDPSTATQPNPAQSPKTVHSGEVKQEDEGQDIVLQSHIGFMENEIKLGSPILDSAQIKAEDTGSQQRSDPPYAPVLATGSPATESPEAAQIQSSMETDMMPRNQEFYRADINALESHPKTISASNHPFPTGRATGRGGGCPGRRAKCSTDRDADPGQEPEDNIKGEQLARYNITE